MITFAYLLIFALTYGLIVFIDAWLYHISLPFILSSHVTEMDTGMWYPIAVNLLTLAYAVYKDFSNWKKRRRPAGGAEAGDTHEANA